MFNGKHFEHLLWSFLFVLGTISRSNSIFQLLSSKNGVTYLSENIILYTLYHFEASFVWLILFLEWYIMYYLNNLLSVLLCNINFKTMKSNLVDLINHYLLEWNRFLGIHGCLYVDLMVSKGLLALNDQLLKELSCIR